MKSRLAAIPEPAVSRRGLMIGAGAAWAVGGVILLWRAYVVGAGSADAAVWVWGLGAALGLLKYRFVFRRVAGRNIARIRELSPHKEKICLFAFQSLQSYLLVLVMVPAGIALRHLGLSASVLGVVYVAIGLGLLLGGVQYIREAVRTRHTF